MEINLGSNLIDEFLMQGSLFLCIFLKNPGSLGQAVLKNRNENRKCLIPLSSVSQKYKKIKNKYKYLKLFQFINP